MRFLQESAGSSAILHILTFKQVENPHQDLCIGLGAGIHFPRYYNINAADLATMYAAGMSGREILLTISYGVLLCIRRPGYLDTWADQIHGVAARHHEQKIIAEGKSGQILAGKDGEALAAHGRLKLRIITELLRAGRDAQTQFDGDQWTRIIPIDWAVTCKVNLEVFLVEGTYSIFAWWDLGWQELRLGTNEITRKLQLEFVFNERTDILNASCTDDEGRRIPPSTMSREEGEAYRSAFGAMNIS